MMWGWGYGGGGSWFGWIGPLVMVLFWVAVVAGVAFFVRFLVRRTGTAEGEDSALEIVRKQYARGEITKAQFEEKRCDLV